jgi:phosphonate transport system permease protein
VVPQFIPQFISFTLYRWDINVRMSTVIGFVGGGGIGFILQQFINLGDFYSAATAIWAIAIVVMVMDWASAKIRERVI